MKLKHIINIFKNSVVYNKFYNFLNRNIGIDSLKFRQKYYMEKNSSKIIKKIADTLGKEDIAYWFDMGTLLGIVRGGRVIKGDLDIDIGVFDLNNKDKITNILTSNGFRLVKEIRLLSNGTGLEQRFEYLGVGMDIFYYESEGDMYVSYVYTSLKNSSFEYTIKYHGGLVPIKQYFPKVEVEKMVYGDFTINIPKNVHDYLSYHYGEDYMTPRSWRYDNLTNDNRNALLITNDVGIVNVY